MIKNIFCIFCVSFLNSCLDNIEYSPENSEYLPNNYDWNIRTIMANKVINTSSNKIVVAVLDSGVESQHPELSNYLLKRIDILAESNVDDIYIHKDYSGIIVIASAVNQSSNKYGINEKVNILAALPNVIAVSSIDKENKLSDFENAISRLLNNKPNLPFEQIREFILTSSDKIIDNRNSYLKLNLFKL